MAEPYHTYSTHGDVGAPVSTQEERTWAAMTHGGALLGWALSLGLGAIVIPVLILVIKGPTSAFVAEHARECLNFQITVFILCLAGIALAFTLIGIPVALMLLFAIMILPWIWMIIGTVRAANGDAYRYPICFRFVR